MGGHRLKGLGRDLHSTLYIEPHRHGLLLGCTSGMPAPRSMISSFLSAIYLPSVSTNALNDDHIVDGAAAYQNRFGGGRHSFIGDADAFHARTAGN